MRLLRAEELFRKVLKGRSKKQARLLGLDVGSKYVGLAVSDDQNRIALPLRKEGNAFSVALRKSGFQVVKRFVVAYPFNLLGQASPDAVQVRLLVGELCNTGKLDNLSYTYWDENFTSKGYLDNMNRELRSADNSEE